MLESVSKHKLSTLLTVATILGGIAAILYLAEIYRKGRASHTPVKAGADASDGARSGPTPSRERTGASSDLGQVQEAAHSADAETLHCSAEETESDSPAQRPDRPSVPDPSHLASALPLDVVLRILRDPGTTDLQKTQFTQREEGRFVVWTGEVRSVRLMSQSDLSSEVLVVLAPAMADRPMFPDLAAAVFPNSEASVLAQVRAGDVIVVEGKLHFSAITSYWSVILSGSRFVRIASRSSSSALDS